MTVRGWWLPAGLRALVTEEKPVIIRDAVVQMPVLTADDLDLIATALAQAKKNVLLERSVSSIVESLDCVAAAWLSEETEERHIALKTLPLITGFSPEMVRESIELEQRSSRAAHMWKALQSEFSDPTVLDGFTDNPHLQSGGQTMAMGPGLTGAIFSSNIPALPHLTVMRSLLVKSAFWGRVSSREPTFLPLYMATIERIDPELAMCCACLWWSKDQTVLEASFLARSDMFIGWGGPEAEAHFHRVVPPKTPRIFHGHRVGFAVVDETMVNPTTVDGLAKDVSLFDQQACLSPQVIIFRGGMESAKSFGNELGRAMARESVRLPPQSLDVGEAAAVQQFRGVAKVAQEVSGGCLVTPADNGLAWTVVVDAPDRFPVSPLHRCISVCVIEHIDDVDRLLRPLRGWLQNAALAVDISVEDVLRRQLVALGVSRICPPGQMSTPSMMWHHDGIACLAAMVRWCDYENSPPDG